MLVEREEHDLEERVLLGIEVKILNEQRTVWYWLIIFTTGVTVTRASLRDSSRCTGLCND